VSDKKGYVIVEVQVHDPKQYEQYAKRSRPAVEAFGGRYTAVGAPASLEGQVPAARVIIVVFASAEKAHEFYRSAVSGRQELACRRRRGEHVCRRGRLDGDLSARKVSLTIGVVDGTSPPSSLRRCCRKAAFRTCG